MHTDVDLLTNLSDEELEAMANSTLSPASQDRLDELLAKNAENERSNRTIAWYNRSS